MRAVVLKGFGGLEMLEERDLPVPEPGPGEVLVRNLAVAVNPVDAKIRAAGRWAGVEPPFVLGYDAAGVVAKVGPGVKDLKEGDEVYYTPEIFGNPHGTYAEYTPVPAGIVAKKPKNLSFAEAAAIPLAGGTAWEAVVRRLAVRPGETVLVMGGAGGVGSFAVQFAKAAGAYVIATASAENLPVLKELGADLALDYRGPWAEEVLKATEGQGWTPPLRPPGRAWWSGSSPWCAPSAASPPSSPRRGTSPGFTPRTRPSTASSSRGRGSAFWRCAPSLSGAWRGPSSPRSSPSAWRT